MFFAIATLQAQVLRRPMAAAYTGLGAYSTHHVDVFSLAANQASLAQLQQGAVGIFGERRFMQTELSNYTAIAALLTRSGNFGLKANYAGFSDYHESQIGLAYARKLGTKIDIGAQFNYNGIQIAGYGNATALSFELGAILHLTDKLHSGIQISNPVGGKYGKNKDEKLSSLYTFGIGYDASEKLLVSAEVQKEEDQPVNVNTGVQYRFLPQFMARVGVATSTSSLWAGVGFKLKSFRIDITSGYHPQLGFTPGVLLLFQFNQKKN